jgi:putative membrane protein
VVTAVLSVLGYIVVIGSFIGLVPVPELGRGTVILFGDLIAVINSIALTALIAGWRFIRRGEVQKHKWAMLTSFALILLFLVIYIWKQAGGFTKEFVVSQGQFLAEFATLITYTYWGMLAVHILLSIIAVPVVLHAVVLGLTHSPTELGDTIHPRVGKAAVAAWSVSLALGIITYLMLNHIYGWEGLRLAG